jgi:TPR repeat protein
MLITLASASNMFKIIKLIIFTLSLSCYAQAKDNPIVIDEINRLIQLNQAEKAFILADKLVSAGSENVSLLEHVALGYLKGLNGINRDVERSFSIYQRAADLGSANSYYMLGETMLNGEQIAQNCKEALNNLIISADMGSLDAKVALANAHYFGTCVPQDIQQTFRYLKQPLKENHSQAFVIMGQIYFFGQGIQADNQKAYEYFKKAADLGVCDAQYNLGVMYENGIYVEANMKKAFNVFDKSSQQGCIDSTVALGSFYYNGKYVKQDYDKAQSLYLLGVQSGSLEAQTYLGLIYLDDPKKGDGKALILDAANKGWDRAQFYTGQFYFYGTLMDKNYLEAFKWFEKAAEQFDPMAFSYLALMHEKGLGAEQDYNQAESFYQKALESGDVKARIALANWYIHGIHYQRDHGKAKDLLTPALEASDSQLVAEYSLLLTCSEEYEITDIDSAQSVINKRERAIHPEQSNWLMIAQAAIYINSGRYSEAIELLKKDHNKPKINSGSLNYTVSETVSKLSSKLYSNAEQAKRCSY